MRRFLFLFFIVLLYGFRLGAQVNADFSSSTTQDCSPFVVNFLDISTGNPVQWEWDFGNGSMSFLQNPSTSYNMNGSYDVTLIVTDASSNTDTIIKTGFITALPKPDVGIQVLSASSGCLPHSVSFQDNTSGGSGTINTWIWDFGDGGVDFSQNPSHEYTFADTFSVFLQVIDANGCIDFEILNDTILTYSIPFVEFEADTQGSCFPPLTVAFGNNSTMGQGLGYLWDFGDGMYSNSKDPVHQYLIDDIFNVKLIVSDSFGCADSLIKNSFIIVTEIDAQFSLNQDEGCLNPLDTFIFFNQSFPPPINNYWNFGDGTTSLLNSPIHKYNSRGIFDVMYIASNYGCSDTAYDTISFHQIEADFSMDTNFQCSAPAQFQFINNSTNAAFYEWDFRDGISSQLADPSHTFVFQGKIPVLLTVENDIGCIDSIAKDITIRGPRAFITPKFDETCIPVDITLVGSTTSSIPIVSSIWDLGYTTIPNADSISLVWDSVGVYLVKLIVTDSAGCTDTAAFSFLTGDDPNGIFLSPDDTVCADTEVDFEMVVDSFTEIFWSDGMGQLGTTTTSVTKFFLSPGYWLPFAFIDYNGCISQPIYPDTGVTIVGPRGRLIATRNCMNPLEIELELAQVGEYDTFAIDPGFGQIIDTTSQTLIFPDTGIYEIVSYLKDFETGCESFDTVELKMYPFIIPRVSSSDTFGCESLLNVSFDATSSYIFDTIGVQGFWEFGNGDTFRKTPFVTWDEFLKPTGIDYDTIGFFTPTFHLFYNGCSFSKPLVIRVYEHNTNFSIDSGGLCTPTVINLVDNSSSLFPLTSLNWYINNFDSAQGPTAQFYIQNEGVYSISLFTVDSIGCTGEKTIIYQLNKPKANFGASQLEACIDDLILFSNFSIGQQFSSFWEFGDATNSTSQNPIKLYSIGDTFTVKLTITDVNGCKDSITKENLIDIHEPQADFSVEPDSSFCPPLIVDFFDSSKSNIVGWKWYFGDGATSLIESPSHTYLTAGKTTVSLVVTDDIGCTDSIAKKDVIEIGGPFADYFVSQDSVCPSDSIQFGVFNVNGTATITWDFGDGVVQTGDTITHAYDSAGYYTPVLIIDNGLAGADNCIVSIILDSIFVDPVEAAFALSYLSPCIPVNVDVVENSINAGQLQWHVNGSDTVLGSQWQINSSGIYDVSLFIESDLGCTDTFNNTIEFFQAFDVSINPFDTLVCDGSTIQLLAEFNPAWTYDWIPGMNMNDSLIHNPIVTIEESEFYQVIVTDTSACQSVSDTAFISVQSPLTVSLTGDTILPFGNPTIIQAQLSQPVASFQWTPVDYLECASCLTSLLTPLESLNYIFSATDSLGCSTVVDTVTIFLADNIKVELPDAFTPNDDGINDVIFPKYRGVKQLINFSIYNRWGARVFATDNMMRGWNGKYKDEIQNIDTYFYVVEAENFFGEIIERKGSFVIVK